MIDEIAAIDALSPSDDRQPLAAEKVAFVVGVIALSGCMFASLFLVLAHFDAVELPGCGAASDCAQAAESRWGRLPGTNWPLSFVGFAYFQALLAAVVYSGGRLPVILQVIVGIGAAISVLLTVAMFAEDYLCDYCFAIHVLNIAFAIIDQLSRWLIGRPVTTSSNCFVNLAIFAATFPAASLMLAVVDHRMIWAAERARTALLHEALDQASPGRNDTGTGERKFAPGRYYLGPRTATVHVVVVSDYQCPSCRTIDAQLRAAVAGRDDISISVRHFPFCTDCNPHINKTRHPNACRAALAAEAAGVVGGADAFWRTHDWLFERHGNFADDDLRYFVREIGLHEDAFFAEMQAESIFALVRADAEAADAAGLRFTPMVFINGKAIDVGQ